MSADVVVVIPTYQRPEKLARCLESIHRQDLGGLVMETVVVEDTTGRFAFGVWNDRAPQVTDGAFVYVCDDTELDPQCIRRAWDVLFRRWPDGDGVIGFNQRNVRGKSGTCRSAMGMVGARFLDRFDGRRPFCPDYSRFHADSELGLYARAVRRFHYETSASLVHYHPLHYPHLKDATHERVRNRVQVQEDRRVWTERRARGLLWGHSNTLIGRRTAQ